MNKTLHHRHLNSLIDDDGKSLYSFKYVKRSTGEIITLTDWVCTSWHSDGNTLNVRNPVNNEVRKLRRDLIIEFNDYEIIM